MRETKPEPITQLYTWNWNPPNRSASKTAIQSPRNKVQQTPFTTTCPKKTYSVISGISFHTQILVIIFQCLQSWPMDPKAKRGIHERLGECLLTGSYPSMSIHIHPPLFIKWAIPLPLYLISYTYKPYTYKPVASYVPIWKILVALCWSQPLVVTRHRWHCDHPPLWASISPETALVTKKVVHRWN